jgi:hypothetical protein
VLAHLRNGDTYQRLAAGFGIGPSTLWRYIHETVDPDWLHPHATVLANPGHPAGSRDHDNQRRPARLPVSLASHR